MTPCASPPNAATASPAKAWLRALELTAPIARNPRRIFSTVIEDRAEASPDHPALLSDRESMNYRQLAARSNQYTRWALARNLAKGDAVALLMPNRPEYVAAWLGIARAGCVVALLNTNLTGASLAHSLGVVAPKHIIVAPELAGQLNSALPRTAGKARVSEQIGTELERHASTPLRAAERPAVTIADPALYIYTSGTTGLPKAARVSHARIMQWSHWFAGMLDTAAEDRLYNCLPLYHSVGGVLSTGAALASGGSVVIRENFSASQFWNDIVRWQCTLFPYIGELCRYLLHTPATPSETAHRIRMCCGNGLRPDIWNEFQSRFRIPQILEFYAATEGLVSLYNVESKPGAIGRIPPYLAHRFPVELVRFDPAKDEPERNASGFCIRCPVNEPGEALGRIVNAAPGAGFEGYTSEEASRKKILHDVFAPGDAWFRTGDLLRKDDRGYFYFVDRIGDTFRWKGENVSTSEVAETIGAFPGIRQASVYGVAIPGADGRAGMAAIVAEGDLDLAAFRAHLSGHLPEYSRPLFLRIRAELEITGTFKFTKRTLAEDGYNPAASADTLYFNHRERGAFVPLTAELYTEIQNGRVRL